MENQDHILLNNLVYACVDSTQRGHEQFVHEHALGYIIAGESHLLTHQSIRVFKAGTVALVRRKAKNLQRFILTLVLKTCLIFILPLKRLLGLHLPEWFSYWRMPY